MASSSETAENSIKSLSQNRLVSDVVFALMDVEGNGQVDSKTLVGSLKEKKGNELAVAFAKNLGDFQSINPETFFEIWSSQEICNLLINYITLPWKKAKKLSQKKKIEVEALRRLMDLLIDFTSPR